MPTVRRCCIVGCMSNSRQNPSLQFFQFPRPDNPFYKLWTQACQASLSRILPFKKPVVCALHFHPHCIGGRRLTGSAVPTLKLEVPSNLKAVEQQAMVEEIERSRKCAYINAVVYEWLVRANLNPQLRGSITHGMIKEKAETAKQIIGCDSFMADNRWLNRFRETHLTGFAQKLASNQLKPMGPSLWIPDIVQDLAHLFPPTSAERIDSFENMPEQYINYMKQYGEYEEDDETSEQEAPQTYAQQETENGYGQDTKLAAQSYYQQQQAAQSYYHHQQHQHHHQQQHHYQHQPPQNGYYSHHSHPGMHPAAAAYSSYHDYYGHERPPPHPQQHYQHQSSHHQQHNGGYDAHQSSQPLPHPGHHESTIKPQPLSPPPSAQQQQHQPPSRPPSHSPPQQNGINNSMPSDRTSPCSPSVNGTAKRPHSADLVNDEPTTKSQRSSPVNRSTQSSPSRPASKSPTPPAIADNAGSTNSNNNKSDINVDNSFKIKLPLANGNGSNSNHGSSSNNSQRSTTPNSQTNNLNSRSNSPKSQNGQTTNGNTSPTPSQSTTTNAPKELETYDQALEYLKPLEDFALFKENFRAIGLISQLETILKKANKRIQSSQITAD